MVNLPKPWLIGISALLLIGLAYEVNSLFIGGIDKKYLNCKYTNDNVTGKYFCDGWSLIEQNRYKEAIEQYDKVLGREPNLVAGRINRAFCHNQLGQYEAALRDADAAIKSEPTSAIANVYRAVALKALGRPNDAIQNLDIATENEPDNAEYYVIKAEAYNAAKQPEKVTETYREALACGDKSINAHYHRALAYYRLGDMKKGKEQGELAVAAQPALDRGWSILANCELSLGEFGSAIEHLDRAIKLAPRYGQYYYSRGIANLLSGNDKVCIADFKKQIEYAGWLDPHSAYAAAFISIAYRRLGDEKNSQFILSKAKPFCSPWALAIVKYLSAELSASEFLAKATEDRNQLTEAHTYIAVDLALKNESAQAKPHLKWVALNGNREFSEFQLASVLEKSLK